MSMIDSTRGSRPSRPLTCPGHQGDDDRFDRQERATRVPAVAKHRPPLRRAAPVTQHVTSKPIGERAQWAIHLRRPVAAADDAETCNGDGRLAIADRTPRRTLLCADSWSCRTRAGGLWRTSCERPPTPPGLSGASSVREGGAMARDIERRLITPRIAADPHARPGARRLHARAERLDPYQDDWKVVSHTMAADQQAPGAWLVSFPTGAQGLRQRVAPATSRCRGLRCDSCWQPRARPPFSLKQVRAPASRCLGGLRGAGVVLVWLIQAGQFAPRANPIVGT